MEEESRQIILDIKHTFSTESGKRVLDHLRRLCFGCYNQSPFIADSAAQTAHNLGSQWVFYYLMSGMEMELDEAVENDACVNEPQQGDSEWQSRM